MATKRAWKLQEFVAHGANVNCLALGHKSGRVLVTGGDDKKVNLWAVGKPNCIMSLSGHTTPVEAVRFGHTEELVCAGSQSGALKIWDLEAARIVRTLTGHKANIRTIDFHPYGDFLASGSADTNIKLWDIRRKGCIFTYKGHSRSVNSLKFSPDGQWIASAGDDAAVKLWDLRAGRLLSEFRDHSGPVSDVEFHPHEFLLAACSQDRTLNFWDLESFQLVSSTDGDSSPVRCIYFNPDGECVFSGSQDSLRVYGWEPSRTYDTVMMHWGKVKDIATAQSQLIGASVHMSSVSLYVVDLKRVSPFGGTPPQDSSSLMFKHGGSVRKSFIKDKNDAKNSPVSMKTVEESDATTDPEDDSTSLADIQDEDDYKAIFHPRGRQYPSIPQPLQPSGDAILPQGFKRSRTPETPRKSSPTNNNNNNTPNTNNNHMLRGAKVNNNNNSNGMSGPGRPSEFRRNSRENLNKIPSEENNKQPRSRSENRKDSVREILKHSQSVHEKTPGVRDSDSPTHLRHSPSEPAVNKLGTKPPLNQNNRPLNRPAIVRPMPKPEAEVQPMRSIKPEPTEKTDKEKIEFIPVHADRPAGIEVDEFLPKKFGVGVSIHGRGGELSEAEVFSSIMKGHESMVAVLKARQRSLQVVYALWQNKDLKTAVETAINMEDQSVIVDLLSQLNLRPSVWNLDVCVVLLPCLFNLLQSRYEAYMLTGGQSLRLILRNFAQVIRNNMQGSPHSVGVDISREERFNKCISCYNHLVSIRAFILKRQTLQGKLGHQFRELHILLQTLD